MGRFLTAVALVAGVALPAVPASAGTATCAFAGSMFTTTAFGAPGVTGSKTGGFAITASTATCNPHHHISLTGSLSGWCGLASGSGSNGGDHAFDAAWQGGSIVLTGGVAGELTVTADASTGQSCVTGATSYLVAGTVTFV